MGTRAITGKLEEEARAEGRADAPSESTVRTLVKEHRLKPGREQILESPFQWPKSMLGRAVPWEAARAGLDLLASRHDRGLGRPTNRLVNWYHRVLLAAPDMPRDRAERLAGWLTTASFMWEEPILESFVIDPGYEWALAYRPWPGGEEERYLKALAREDDPLPGTAYPSLGWEVPITRDTLAGLARAGVIREVSKGPIKQHVDSASEGRSEHRRG